MPPKVRLGRAASKWRYVYNIQGTGVVLQVHWDSVNPTKNVLISWVDHIQNIYDLIYIYNIFFLH